MGLIRPSVQDNFAVCGRGDARTENALPSAEPSFPSRTNVQRVWVTRPQCAACRRAFVAARIAPSGASVEVAASRVGGARHSPGSAGSRSMAAERSDSRSLPIVRSSTDVADVLRPYPWRNGQRSDAWACFARQRTHSTGLFAARCARKRRGGDGLQSRSCRFVLAACGDTSSGR